MTDEIYILNEQKYYTSPFKVEPLNDNIPNLT